MAGEYQVNSHNSPAASFCDRYSDSSLVPDMKLECDEMIQNWDNIEQYDGYRALKNEARSSTKSPICIPVSGVAQLYDDVPPSDQLQMYEEATPPNSPITRDRDGKQNLLQENNDYVNHLLQLWRESAEYNSAESTQVNLDEYEHSQGWGNLSDDGLAWSHSDAGSSNESQGSGDVNMEDDSSNAHHSQQDSAVESSFRNISFLPGSRSNSPLNVNTLGPYDLLRSVSPRLMRSPSPLFPVHRLLRSPSPNWEELQANLSEITPQDIILFASDRYSVRSRSPASVSDQEVPDIEMDVQSFYSDSDDNTVVRSRTAQSCQDQVVPEFIEE